MNEVQITLLIFAILAIHALAFGFGWLHSDDYPFLLPTTIYKNNSVNWFGAIFLYILYCLTTPIWAVITLFIYLCTVGRD